MNNDFYVNISGASSSSLVGKADASIAFDSFVSINDVTKAKGLTSNRALRLEINKPNSKYIARKVKVNGGETYETLYSTLEADVQEILSQMYSGTTALVPADYQPQNFESESAKITALARFDIVKAALNFRSKYRTNKEADAVFLELFNLGQYLPKLHNYVGNISIGTLHRWIKVKTYTDRKEYYFCGIKYYTKHVEYKDEKIFVAVLMACFGDVILCNSLFQNIKKLYPNSKTIFIVDKPWEEAAKYQKDVDEVYVFDKRGKNKGIFGLLKFILNFPYKNIDYVFKIYDNFRTDLIASLLIPRLIIGKPYNPDLTVQERHCYLLKKITHKKIQNYPIVYNADGKLTDKFKDIITNDKKYIAICPCSSRIEKKYATNNCN